MSESTITIISIIAIINLCAISVLSFVKRKQHISFFWLSLMFFTPAIAIADNVCLYNGKGSVILYHLALPLNMVWGGYSISIVKSLEQINDKKLIIHWKLFIPALFYLPFFILSILDTHWMQDVFVFVKENKLTGFGIFFNIIIGVYAIFSSIYLLTKEYYGKEKQKETISNRKTIKEVLWVLCALQLLAFVPFAFKFDIEYIRLYMPVFGQIFFMYIFFRMAYSSHLFIQTAIPVIEKEKYASIKIDDNNLDEIQSRIQQLMEVEKAFLQIDFTLAELSKQINVPVKTISMVVNSRLQCSFPDFVNGYRVKFAIELLKNLKKENLTIEAIAFESGFNNRTSFYNALKKHTGKVPTDFIVE